MLGIKLSSLEPISQSLECFIGSLEVTLRETLRKFLRVLITFFRNLKVRQRVPQGGVHFRFIAVENLVKLILKSRDFSNRFPTNLLRRLLGVHILRNILRGHQLIDGAFHFRGKHLVLFDHRNEVLDLVIGLLISVGQHHTIV